ncbi:MAG TPA: homoserine O-acetyltransferase [Chloroflexia bacterium]|nr:homoserine O-acetyltransferase [Chloroflexia bacterium]
MARRTVTPLTMGRAPRPAAPAWTGAGRLDDDPSVTAHGDGRPALESHAQQWHDPAPLRLDGGQTLPAVQVAYETWGRLNAAADNVVVICHALTGDAHAAGLYPGDSRPGWWDPLIGPGRALDTDRYFVICTNLLGGCRGSTGPASLDPATGRPYGSRFPQITVRDMVRLQGRLLAALGVRGVAAVLGGSLGGMQVLEWAVLYPHLVRRAVTIGATLAHPAQGIAYNLIGREAIMQDPAWQGGDYYGTGRAPDQGLRLARMIGMITYQSAESMARKFARQRVAADPESYYDPTARFQVENYLYYQGESLVRRFDANSYLVLTRAMDLHDLAQGRGSLAAALAQIDRGTRVLAIGINSDILFPTNLQRAIVAALRAAGRPAHYAEIDSPWGHDAFLIEYAQLGGMIARFLDGATDE